MKSKLSFLSVKKSALWYWRRSPPVFTVKSECHYLDVHLKPLIYIGLKKVPKLARYSLLSLYTPHKAGGGQNNKTRK